MRLRRQMMYGLKAVATAVFRYTGYFNGVTNAANSTAAGIALSTNFEFFCEFQLNGKETPMYIVKTYSGSDVGTELFCFIYNFVNNTVEFYSNALTNSPRTAFTPAIMVSSTAWHKLKVTYNGATLRLYYNDVLDVERTVAMAWTASTLDRINLASYGPGLQNGFLGSIDRAYISLNGAMAVDYQFTETSGDILDSSGNGIHLTPGSGFSRVIIEE